MDVLRVEPLTPDAYEPFGGVIMASPHGEAGGVANQGTARRFDHLAAFENLRPNARADVAVFRCEPRRFPFEMRMLEKHPGSTQIFVPMRATRYVVAVALGGDRPDLATVRAFVATAGQGVSYRPGVWHHPMLALDGVTEFACFVHEDGTHGDCVEFAFDPSEFRTIVLDQ